MKINDKPRKYMITFPKNLSFHFVSSLPLSLSLSLLSLFLSLSLPLSIPGFWSYSSEIIVPLSSHSNPVIYHFGKDLYKGSNHDKFFSFHVSSGHGFEGEKKVRTLTHTFHSLTHFTLTHFTHSHISHSHIIFVNALGAPNSNLILPKRSLSSNFLFPESSQDFRFSVWDKSCPSPRETFLYSQKISDPLRIFVFHFYLSHIFSWEDLWDRNILFCISLEGQRMSQALLFISCLPHPLSHPASLSLSLSFPPTLSLIARIDSAC